MRLANGTGSVYKLSGNRRNPWIARKTIGWTDEGKQIYKTIGYYTKKEQALKALLDYNQNPYSLESNITFSELFEKWKDLKYSKLSKTAQNGYNSAYKLCKDLNDIKFVDIRANHLENVIKHCNKGYDTHRKIKSLYNQLYKYAMANDIVSKDYAEFVELHKEDKESSRNPFTQQEIDRLFDVSDKIDFVDTVLILIFSGLRIGELLTIKTKAVNLVDRVIVGGIKTEAGKNRSVPISYKIFEFVKKRAEQGNEYLIVNAKGEKMKYDNYLKERFIPIMEQLNFKHKPHDTRHTFISLLKEAGADNLAVQKIVGHKKYETTANIYTHVDLEFLRKAVDLL